MFFIDMQNTTNAHRIGLSPSLSLSGRVCQTLERQQLHLWAMTITSHGVFNFGNETKQWDEAKKIWKHFHYNKTAIFPLPCVQRLDHSDFCNIIKSVGSLRRACNGKYCVDASVLAVTESNGCNIKLSENGRTNRRSEGSIMWHLCMFYTM